MELVTQVRCYAMLRRDRNNTLVIIRGVVDIPRRLLTISRKSKLPWLLGNGKVGAKSVRNLIALMRKMWHSAMAWGYVQHDPFFGIVLPDRGLVRERFFSLDEMKKIIEAAKEPYKTYFWILAETGVRAGEIGALPVSNLLLDHGAIRITQNVWHSKIQTVKSVRRNPN